MNHPSFSDNWHRELNRENDNRPDLLGENTSSAYRFGRLSGGRVWAGARAAARSVVRVLRVMHEAMLASRLRRAERELQVGSPRIQALSRRIGGERTGCGRPVRASATWWKSEGLGFPASQAYRAGAYSLALHR